MDGSQRSSAQLLDRNEQLVKENEALKEQSVTLSHRMDTLQKEVNDILVCCRQKLSFKVCFSYSFR